LKSDLLVETHDLFATTGSCQQLFARLGHGVPLLWDLQHTGGTHGEPPRETWEALGHWVQHVHVSDRSCLRSPFEIVLPGSGVLPVIETLEILVNAQFKGVVSLEWEKLWHPEIPCLEEALHAAKEQWFGLGGGLHLGIMRWAARYNALGIVANESSLRAGEQLAIPDFGWPS
jgi:hypothetical protein